MTLVYPATTKLELFRAIARDTNIKEDTKGKWTKGRLFYTFKQVPKDILEGRFEFGDCPIEKYTPEEVLADFIQEGGINLAHTFRYDGPRLTQATSDPYETHDSPVALEPLIYGCGVLRPTFKEGSCFESAVTLMDGEDVYPEAKLRSPLIEIVGDYILTWTDHERDPTTRKDVPIVKRNPYEGTNIVYGDSYGELEQLWRRRNNRRFVGVYLKALQAAAKTTEVEAGLILPQGIVGHRYKADDRKIWMQHVEQNRIWNSPPETQRELLDRVQYLLTEIVIDTNAYESVPEKMLIKANDE